jgi:hypothetical protein
VVIGLMFVGWGLRKVKAAWPTKPMVARFLLGG